MKTLITYLMFSGLVLATDAPVTKPVTPETAKAVELSAATKESVLKAQRRFAKADATIKGSEFYAEYISALKAQSEAETKASQECKGGTLNPDTLECVAPIPEKK